MGSFGDFFDDAWDSTVEFVDDSLDDYNDYVSGVGEIMDDQLGFDPNGGGLVPYYDAAGMATVGVPIGSIGAQGSNALQTLESGDFGGDFWRSSANNAIRGGTSFTAGGGFGSDAQSFLGGSDQLLGNFGTSTGGVLSGLVGTGGYNPNAQSPNFGTSALMSGRNVGNAAAALYQADQARGAGNDYLNYLYDAMAVQKGAQGEAADLIGGAYDQALERPGQLRDFLTDQTGGYLDTLKNLNAADSVSRRDAALGIRSDEKALLGQELNKLRDMYKGSAGKQRDLFKATTQDALGRFSPYASGGADAQNVLTELLTGTPSDRLAGLVKSPGYNFRLSEGMQALDRSAAARGGLLSGATLKQAQRYGQDMASQEFDKYVNQLAGLSSQGYKAAGSQAELDSKLGLNLANVIGTEKSDLAGAYQDFYGEGADSLRDYRNRLLEKDLGYSQGKRDIADQRRQLYSGIESDYLGDQTTLGLGRATNLANILTGGAAQQTDLLGQLARNQYGIQRDTTPEIQAGAAVGDLFSNPQVQQGISSGLEGLFGGIGDLFGGSGGGGTTYNTSPSFSAFDFGNQPGFAGGSTYDFNAPDATFGSDTTFASSPFSSGGGFSFGGFF